VQTYGRIQTRSVTRFNSWLAKWPNDSLIKQIALITSLINLFISIIIWIQFDPNFMGNQFVITPTMSLFNFFSSSSDSVSTLLSGSGYAPNVGLHKFLDLKLGVDGISLFFVLLTTFITPIALLSSHSVEGKDIDNNLNYYLILILFLETLQIAVFISLDLLLFYIFFESVLIPLFLMVGMFGSSKDKVRAAYLLFLYTLWGSLFMLLALLEINNLLGSTDFSLLNITKINVQSQYIIWGGFFLAFAVKTPLWPFTGWLFRAHVEAPLSISIILAAIILKLATYGIVRILLNYFPDANFLFTPFVQAISIITLFYASLSALRSPDSKELVALSSISHCAVIVIALFSNSVSGIEGAIIVSLGHGFVSPALFIIVGGIIYIRLHTRIISHVSGLTTYMPILSIIFLVVVLSNASVPLTAGWIGEQLSLIGIFMSSPWVGLLSSFTIFLTGMFSLYAFNKIMLGDYNKLIFPIKDIARLEGALLIPLAFVPFVMGVCPIILSDPFNLVTSNLIYSFPDTSVISPALIESLDNNLTSFCTGPAALVSAFPFPRKITEIFWAKGRNNYKVRPNSHVDLVTLNPVRAHQTARDNV
jgi:NADH-ubiquinone oxidoreductase chain 4